MKYKTAKIIAIISLTYSAQLSASEMRYRPINPNFGGNTFNGSYLLGIAEAQNKYKEKREDTNPIDNFERTVTSTLISRISQEIADRILGEDAADSGQFTIGSTVLNFNRVGDLVKVNIIDNTTGQQTTVEVPAPTF
jgi:curli production assembly/transport component CsgF